MTAWKARVRQRWQGAALSAAFTLALGLILFFSPALGRKAVFLSYDIPFALRQVQAPTNVVVVYLDENSIETLGQPLTSALPRSFHARLVQRLQEAGAAAVVFDFLFTDPGPKPAPGEKSDDQKFADAIKAHGKVVLGGMWATNAALLQQSVASPIRVLREAAAAWGLAQFDRFDYAALGPREHLDLIDDLPSLPWATAKVMEAPVTKTSSQAAVRRWINYYGPPDSLPHVSYADVYEGTIPPGFRPNYLRGKVVFIGSRQSAGLTGAAKDEFPTAFTWQRGVQAPGAEIHAMVFLNLLRQDWLTRLPGWLEMMLIVLTGLGAGFGLSTFYSRLATALALLAALFVVAAAWVLFRYQLVWLAWMILLVQLFFALIWSWGFNSIQSYVERAVLERSLALHLPARRVKQLLKSPELLAPSAEKQEVSLMFTDIADWSTISERLTPDRLFKLLNRYFQETIPCVHQQDGMVLTLVGDAIFALWNAPEPQKDHQEHACAAALNLRDQLVQFESANESYPLRTRVGLHCGLASVGNCGSTDRLFYTALGAETNMASRLEGLNKYLGTNILASDRIVEAVEEKFVWRNVGRFRLKGGDRVMEIYELVDALDQAEASRAWRQEFSLGLRHFQHARWDEAMQSFCEVIVLRKEDGPSRFYLRKIEKLRHETMPEKWFGEVSMDDK